MKHYSTCTISGVIKDQPGISASVVSSSHEIVLHVGRFYNKLIDQFGGYGLYKKADAYGQKFQTVEQAWEYALEHGYIRPWFKRGDLEQDLQRIQRVVKQGYKGKRKYTKWLIHKFLERD